MIIDHHPPITLAFGGDEAKMMEIKKLKKINSFELLELMREKGVVVGNVVMNTSKFLSMCHVYGIHPMSYRELLSR